MPTQSLSKSPGTAAEIQRTIPPQGHSQRVNVTHDFVDPFSAGAEELLVIPPTVLLGWDRQNGPKRVGRSQDAPMLLQVGEVHFRSSGAKAWFLLLRLV